MNFDIIGNLIDKKNTSLSLKQKSTEEFDSLPFEDNNKVPRIDYNAFELYNYDIPDSIITEIVDRRIPPYNIYMNGVIELNIINCSDLKKQKVFNSVNEMIRKKDSNRNIYELMYCGISKSSCGKLLEKGLSIKLIKKLTLETLKEKYNIGNKMASKYKKIIDMVDGIIAESNRNIKTECILEKVLRDNTKTGPITLYKLKKILEENDVYIIDNFSKDYKKLLKENKINSNMYGIEYNYISIESYIKKIFDSKISSILIDRFNGKTLESIAQKHGVTRERIRQICKRLDLNSIKEFFKEDKYEDIFEKYQWNQEIFCKLFKEKPITFNYLNERYKVGNVELNDIINDDYFTESQKEKYKSLNNLVITSDGELISGKDDFIRKFLVKYALDEIDIDDLTNKYNDEIKKYPELGMEQITSRNLEARLSRSNYAFFGSNHKVRFFDYDSLSEESIEQLRELIVLNDGFYSTEYIFRNNIELMDELDIRNENELHNILKTKIDDSKNNVYFLRMPNFLVEYHEKDDFLLEKIREYSPIPISDFIDFLYDEYGHKKNTMLAYLTTNFSEYIKDGCFDIETSDISDEEISILKSKFVKDVYSIDDVKKILENSEFIDTSLVLTSRNMTKLGYKMKGSFIIKNQYGGVYEYIENMMENNDILKLDDDILKIPSVRGAINYYCEKFVLFKIADNNYITDNKLRDLGIMKDEIVELIKKTKDKFSDKDYFSVHNVFDEINCSIFIDMGLSEDFLEDMISYIDGVKILRINNNRLFTFTRKHPNISDFMYDMVNKYSSISLDNLEKEIQKNYQVNIPYEKLREYLYGTDIFYSDILGKIYSDKNCYYEEVYNE